MKLESLGLVLLNDRIILLFFMYILQVKYERRSIQDLYTCIL